MGKKHLQGVTVLVVDDDADAREVLRQMVALARSDGRDGPRRGRSPRVAGYAHARPASAGSSDAGPGWRQPFWNVSGRRIDFVSCERSP